MLKESKNIVKVVEDTQLKYKMFKYFFKKSCTLVILVKKRLLAFILINKYLLLCYSSTKLKNKLILVYVNLFLVLFIITIVIINITLRDIKAFC